MYLYSNLKFWSVRYEDACASLPPPSGGIGLKSVHYNDVLSEEVGSKKPGWVEVHPQNYFGDGGPLHVG